MAENKLTPEEYLKELEACLSEHREILGKLVARAEADSARRKELEASIPDTSDELQWLQKKLPSMKEELAGLGFFSVREKKKLSALIETAESTIAEMTGELAAMKEELDTILKEKIGEKLLAERSVVSDLEADIAQTKQFIEQTRANKKKKVKITKRQLLGEEMPELFVFDPDDDEDDLPPE